MSDMVEKVAAAIYMARNGRGAVPWSRRDASHKAPYLIDARAAIEAMREPAAEATLRRIIREELDNYDRDKGVTPRMSRNGVRADWPFKLTGP